MASILLQSRSAGNGNAATLGAADWLCLAAAPIFALMALLTGLLGGGASDTLCSGAPDAFPLSGMALMYLLMSAFHAAPWLRLISARRSNVFHRRGPAMSGGLGAIGESTGNI